MEYEINLYTFVDRKTKTTIQVLARTSEKAKEIANLYTNGGEPYKWKRKLFGFCKKATCGIPPYEVETEEMEQATKKPKRTVR